jgi:hypothetical protein
MITGYQTGNVAIATTLHTLGIPWWKNEHGQPVPCFVRYDIDILSKLAAKELPELKGKDLDEGARLAHQRGKKGNVRYNFEQNDLLARILKAWGKHEDWMKEADGKSPGNGTAAMDFPEIEPETAARLFCQWSKNRTKIANLWKTAPESAVMVDYPGKTRRSTEPTTGPQGQSGERTVITGSFKSHSLNASPATKKRLGVK